MEILKNFSSIYCFISFVIGAVFMLAILSIAAIGKEKKPSNKVHFYVARDKDGKLWLYLGKPERRSYSFLNSNGAIGSFMANEYHFIDFGLTPDDFKNLKWEDEPVEVFLNMKD